MLHVSKAETAGKNVLRGGVPLGSEARRCRMFVKPIFIDVESVLITSFEPKD